MQFSEQYRCERILGLQPIALVPLNQRFIYLGGPVMLPSNDAAIYYVKYWLFVLPKLLGWSRDQTVLWAERFTDDLRNENSWLYHEPPSYEVSRLLVPRRFRTDTPPGINPMRVAAALENQFWSSVQNVDAIVNFDWEAAIERIDAVLRQYGSSLDEVRRQYRPDDT